MISKFSKLAMFLAMVLFGACEGPEGPPGPQGPQGAQGPQGQEGYPGPEAVVYEYGEVNFEAPEFGVRLPFDEQAGFTDMVLVYGLWYTEETDDSQLRDVWRLFPQSIFLEDEENQEPGRELVYNFTHSDVYADVFLEANFDIAAANLGPTYLNDWIIRVVVVPGGTLTNGRGSKGVDLTDYKSVKKYFNLPDLPNPAIHTQPARPMSE